MKRQITLLRLDGAVIQTRQAWIENLPGVVLYQGSAFVLREPDVYYEVDHMEIDPPRVTHIEAHADTGHAKWPQVLKHLGKRGDSITITNVHSFKPGLYTQAKKHGIKIKGMLTNKGLKITRVA